MSATIPLDALITADQSWLSFVPSEVTTDAARVTVKVVFNTSTLAPGVYTATITVTAANACNSPQRIPVKLIVTAIPVPPDVGDFRRRRNPRYDRSRLQPINWPESPP